MAIKKAPHKKIMVVEDNEATREGLIFVLQREGFNVVAFEDGQPALDYLGDGQHPDLIVLDILMPVLDGWDFLWALQKAPVSFQVPIIVITGAILSNEWLEAHDCAGFLRKPFEGEQLLAEIERCLAG